jgi:Na+-transporting NADH:ubiquinone oxidoreductase subunit C
MGGKALERFRTIGFMAVITAVFIAAVSGVHVLTAEVVARNEKLYLQTAVLEAAAILVPDTPAAIAACYNECVKPVPDAAAPDYYEIYKRDQAGRAGYVFVRDGVGLWGAITAVVGVDADLATLTGASFVKHNETPGLGARIDEQWFMAQLAGKRPPLTLVPEETADNTDAQIDQITGATITSRGVRDLLNKTVAEAAARLDET